MMVLGEGGGSYEQGTPVTGHVCPEAGLSRAILQAVLTTCAHSHLLTALSCATLCVLPSNQIPAC